MNTKRAFLSYLVSLGVVFTAISVHVFNTYIGQYPFPVGQQFDPFIQDKYRNMINRNDPQILFLGDSLIDSNIDPGLVAEHMNKRVSIISEHGSGSALYFLIIKNNIITSRQPPEMLVILSRGSMLTAPGFRVHGSFFAHLDDFGGEDDDLVLELGIRNQMNPVERFAEMYFPPYWGRWHLRAALDSKARYLPTRALLGCSRECSDSSMEEVFGSQNFNPSFLNDAINWTESYFYTEENLDFNDQVDGSFLPEIIRLCREHNIQLVIVQTKTLHFSREYPEPEALREYTKDLMAYAQANNVLLIDFSNEPRLTQELFYDENHLNPDGKLIFSELLIKELKKR
jgi:hypothetical protein